MQLLVIESKIDLERCEKSQNVKFNPEFTIITSEHKNFTSKDLRTYLNENIKIEEIVFISQKLFFLYEGLNLHANYEIKMYLISSPTLFDYSRLLNYHHDLFPKVSGFEKQKLNRINEHWLVLDKKEKNLIRRTSAVFGHVEKLTFKYYTNFLFLDFQKFCRENKIDKVILIGPHRHTLKRWVYYKLRKSNVDFYIVERGALPGSWFFDPDGFNGESRAYAKDKWEDIQINHEKEATIKRFKDKMVSENEVLEFQPDVNESQSRVDELRKVINGRKVIFIPLQRPRDTVIRFFNPKGLKRFYESINSAIDTLDSQKFFFLIKKHPLEKKVPGKINRKKDNLKILNDEFHIHDILDMTDHTVLINSGVGVLSLLFNKPVSYFGQAFYKVPGSSSEFSNSSELVKQVHSSENYNKKESLKFLYFLIKKYYLFSKVKKITYNSEKEDYYIFSSTGILNK